MSVTWRFKRIPSIHISVPDVGAVWVSEQDVLHVDAARGLSRSTWLDIARELAFAIGADPSHLAALRDILEAESEEEANDFLDRLSIPRLSEFVPVAPVEEAGHGADEVSDETGVEPRSEPHADETASEPEGNGEDAAPPEDGVRRIRWRVRARRRSRRAGRIARRHTGSRHADGGNGWRWRAWRHRRQPPTAKAHARRRASRVVEGHCQRPRARRRQR